MLKEKNVCLYFYLQVTFYNFAKYRLNKNLLSESIEKYLKLNNKNIL